MFVVVEERFWFGFISWSCHSWDDQLPWQHDETLYVTAETNKNHLSLFCLNPVITHARQQLQETKRWD